MTVSDGSIPASSLRPPRERPLRSAPRNALARAALCPHSIRPEIFPGSLLPSVAAINNAVNNTTDMTLVDLKDIGLHYATTLVHWREQFSKNISKIKELGFNDQFIRKWNYYLSYCEAAFRMRNIAVAQVVLARPNNYLLV